MKNSLNFKCEGNAIELKMYGEIGERWWKEEDDDNVYSLKDLEQALKDHKDAATIDIYINSCGGSVFDGVAMYNMLKRHKAYKRVFIDGFACSVASVIAMCGNQIIMPKSSMMMIHNAWTIVMGNAKELRKQADDLDKINQTIKNAYLGRKLNIDEDTLTNLMDEESYLTADECFEYGLCTKVAEDIDGEEVQNKVNEALEKMSGLYQNKLETLNALKNCIKEIENDTELTEEAEEESEAEAIETESIEAKEESIEVDVQNEVHNIQENALKRFFNLQEGKNNE